MPRREHVAAAGSDDLVDTVDYGQVANAVHAVIVGEPVDLIETLAERVADACLAFGGVLRVAVTVHKPHAPIEVPFEDVEVRIVRSRDPMREVALALGSNLGDSAALLQGAIDDLAATDGIELTAVSAAYETDPVGGPEQEPYLNAVVAGRTSLSDAALLAATQSVERAWHRVRDVRWGPRTLDIDILAIDDQVIDTDDLVVPHPRAHERGFVLVPWLDVAPDAVVAGRGRVADLAAVVDVSGVRRSPVALHLPPARARAER